MVFITILGRTRFLFISFQMKDFWNILSLVLKSKEDCLEIVSVQNDDPLVDGFNEYYRPDELTVFEEKFEWNMDSTNK
jgi:hypothetical protein